MNKDKQTDWKRWIVGRPQEWGENPTTEGGTEWMQVAEHEEIVRSIEAATRKRIEEWLQKRLSTLRVLEEMRHGEDDAVSAEIVAYESVLASLPSREEQ